MCHDGSSLFACLLGPTILYNYPLLQRCRKKQVKQQLVCLWTQHQEVILKEDTWLDCIMDTNYDEDLSQNAFFQILQQEYQSIFNRAIGEGWIICAPRSGTFIKAALTEEDFLSHILIPDNELPGTHFHTLTNREVQLCNKTLKIKYELEKSKSLNLLFEETFYTNELNKYCVWCIEGLLEEGTITSSDEVSVVTSLKECVDLLWAEVLDKNILKELDTSIEDFEKNHKSLENECIQMQHDLVSMLYAKSLRIILKDTRLRERTVESHYFLQTVKVAIETYVLHGLRRILPPAVQFRTAPEDASLNKIIKNLHDLQLQDLGVRSDLYEGVTRGKLELSRLDGYLTVLGKINCLKTAVRFVSQGETSVSSDDLLPVLIFLVIKSGLVNWYAQLTFMKQFRYSANSVYEADEAGFLVTSLEAAVEHVKSDSLRIAISHIDEKVINNQKKLTHLNGKDEIDDLGESTNELFENIKKGNLIEVQRILTEKPEGTSKELKLCHPLCFCDSCERSLSKSTNPDLSDLLSCLHIACLHGQVAVVNYLLELGLDPNVADAEGVTGLHCAASRGHQNTLLLLLHANAEPNLIDSRGNNSLHLAADFGHETCVKAILYFAEQSRITVNVSAGNLQGDTALHFASKWGYSGIVEILLEYGADPSCKNRRGQTAMSIAHSSHISRLFEGLSSRTSTPTECLEFSQYRCKDTNAIKGAPKTSSETAIPNSYRSGLTDGVRKIDRLFAAVAECDMRLASFYLGLEGPCNKTYVSEQDELKFCHPLCNCDKCTTIEELSYEKETKPPIAINAVNSKGETALHIASAVGCTEIIQVLLDAGAKVNLVTRSEGRTPLHLACLNERTKAVKMLLNCGDCNVDAKDNVRDTPLHLSARASNVRIVEMLVRHGANPRLRNLNGATPLDEVENMKSDDIFLSLAITNIVKILKNIHATNPSQ